MALSGCTGGGWTKCRHLEAGDLQKHSILEGEWLRVVVEYRVLDGSPTKVEWRTTDTFLKQLPKSRLPAGVKEVPAGTKEYAEGVVILKPGEQVRCDRM